MERYDYLTRDEYLVRDSDVEVLKNLSNMGEHLKKLHLKMLETEAAYQDARKEFEYYSGSILSMQMHDAGIEELKLASGGKLIYKRKYYCTPNKNEADKAVLARWLREHGAPDKLVQERLAVDASEVDTLRKAGVPYVEINDFNTNSLKAFISDLLGLKGSPPKITMDDIPECAHFSEAGMVTIDL